MKKLLVVLALALVAVLAFAGCAPSTCEVCNKEGVKTSKVEIDGESGYVCDDCKEMIEGLKNLAEAVGVDA